MWCTTHCRHVSFKTTQFDLSGPREKHVEKVRKTTTQTKTLFMSTMSMAFHGACKCIRLFHELLCSWSGSRHCDVSALLLRSSQGVLQEQNLCALHRTTLQPREAGVPRNLPARVLLREATVHCGGMAQNKLRSNKKWFPNLPKLPDNNKQPLLSREKVSRTQFAGCSYIMTSCLSAASSREHFFSQCVTTWSDPPGTMC